MYARETAPSWKRVSSSTTSGAPSSRSPKQRRYITVSPATTATAAPGTPLRATMPAASWSKEGTAALTAAAASTRRAAAATAAARRPPGSGETGARRSVRERARDGEGTTGAAEDGAEGVSGTSDGADDGVAVGAGEAGAAASTAGVRDGTGDGSADTRMPQPASSVAAPAAASTLARHQGVTVSLLRALAVFFAAASEIPPGPRHGDRGCRLPGQGVEETGTTMLVRSPTGNAQQTAAGTTQRTPTGDARGVTP